ncbi:MAG TPA: hypothetical protein VIP78_03100, partial [Candidatus Dormibacteraeota bacterium]
RAGVRLHLSGDDRREHLKARASGRSDEIRVPVLVLTVKSLAPSEVSALEKAGVTAVLPKEAGATQAAVSLITEALVTKVKNA